MVVVVAACGGASARSAPPAAAAVANTELGTFRFAQRVQETSPAVTLEGTVEITRDSVTIDMTPGPCRYDELSSRNTTFRRYQCADVIITVDRVHPATRVGYALTTNVQVPVRTCVRYGTGDAARQCLQYLNSLEDRRVWRTGRLRLSRTTG